jgi:hypothetical protein
MNILKFTTDGKIKICIRNISKAVEDMDKVAAVYVAKKIHHE